MEMQGADRVVLEKLCHSQQLPQEVVHLYEKARVGWERIQGGPMPSDTLLMIVLQCDAIHVPEIIPNRFQAVAKGTAVYWASGDTRYHGTFSHCCQEPFEDDVVVHCFGDPELARQVRAVEVETESEMTARTEQAAIDADTPEEQPETQAVVEEPAAEPEETAPEAVADVAPEAEPEEDEPPAEDPVDARLRQEWAGTKRGTKLHVAEPNAPVMDATFLKLLEDDSLEVSIAGEIRKVSPVDVMRA